MESNLSFYQIMLIIIADLRKDDASFSKLAKVAGVSNEVMFDWIKTATLPDEIFDKLIAVDGNVAYFTLALDYNAIWRPQYVEGKDNDYFGKVVKGTAKAFSTWLDSYSLFKVVDGREVTEQSLEVTQSLYALYKSTRPVRTSTCELTLRAGNS